MDDRARPTPAAASFLCSPIPRDPSQLLFVDSERKASAGRRDQFFDPEAEEMTGLRRGVVALDGDSRRATKRPRLEAESAAIVKSEVLSTEVESLRVQLTHRIENHQIQLKERDQQVNQLRRQLQYALTEEEHTRAELKTLTNEYANEKLQLQKKIVELESKLQFVEDSFAEWREKADDTISELQSAARKAKLTIQLQEDEIESLKHKDAPPPPVEYSALESKIKFLETSLRDKELEVQAADERIQNASMTLESSKDVRVLNERIVELESQERRLKQELVELIASSRNSAVHDEKLSQMRQKLQASEQRYAQAQQEMVQLNIGQRSLHELKSFFKDIVFEINGSTSALEESPSSTIITAYKKLQSTMKSLEDEKKRAQSESGQLQQLLDAARETDQANRRKLAAANDAVRELELKLAAANRAFSPMQKTNEELLALLQSYKNEDNAATTDEVTQRLARLDAALSQAVPLVKQLDSLAAAVGESTPFIARNYEKEIEQLRSQLALSQGETKKLGQQLESTERECAALEKRLGRGEFNPDTTKVVHMAVNPTSELLGVAQQTTELEALRREITRLRSQLSGVSSAATPTTPALMTTPAAKLTTTTSYETVEGQKLLNQRLKEVFQNQIKQYREAVYQLTGFKVDLRKSNGVEILKLRSMYADHDDDELIVRMEPDGTLELLPSDFSAQINKRVFAYLTTCRSFPAFLSTLTLHLFERQTFQGT